MKRSYSMEEFEIAKQQALRSFSFFQAVGCSWKGNEVRRDENGKAVKRGGKEVTCGHKHRRRSAAERCCDRMKKDRPGKCPTYRVNQYDVLVVSRSRN